MGASVTNSDAGRRRWGHTLGIALTLTGILVAASGCTTRQPFDGPTEDVCYANGVDAETCIQTLDIYVPEAEVKQAPVMVEPSKNKRPLRATPNAT